jgi:hypothetical protein
MELGCVVDEQESDSPLLGRRLRIIERQAEPTFARFVAASSVTDATGFGQAIYELGNVLGAQRVSVKVGSQNPITFRMTATTAAASVLRIASGNNQNGFVASPLKNPLVVEVTDAVGNPKPGVLVNFIVASGGGTVSASSVASDAQGRASVNWTLGPNEGAQAVTVTSAGLPPVIFTTNASELRLASISAGAGMPAA